MTHYRATPPPPAKQQDHAAEIAKLWERIRSRPALPDYDHRPHCPDCRDRGFRAVLLLSLGRVDYRAAQLRKLQERVVGELAAEIPQLVFRLAALAEFSDAVRCLCPAGERLSKGIARFRPTHMPPFPAPPEVAERWLRHITPPDERDDPDAPDGSGF